MKKQEIINELCRHVYCALDEQLTEDEYQDFISGSVSFRLDLVRKPSRTFVTVDLPPKTAAPKKLKISFKRPYTRRQGIPVQGVGNAE